MSLREYPPTGIGAGSTWTKDTGDTITSRTGSSLARYKFKVTSASYANGWYVASADSIYSYSASTAYNADEWPPSGAFDKLDGSSSTKQGLSSGEAIFTNTADASPGMNVYISLPHYIKLNNYNIKLRTDSNSEQAPTKWNVYGSTRSASSWTLIHAMTATGWTIGANQTFTASSSTGYNSFRFEFLRNNSSTTAYLTVGEIRLYGYPEIRISNIINDGYPNDLTTGNSYGMTPQTFTRISTLRGLHGMPKGNIKFSDIITKFVPTDNLFPSTPFRIRTNDGIYVRYDTSNSQVNGTAQHIYFTTQLDTSSDYSGYKKHAYMYFLKDIGQNLYWNHNGLVTWMYASPFSVNYGMKAVPSHTVQNQYLIRSVYNGNYYMGYDSVANRFRIDAQGSANIKNFIFDVDDYPPVTSGLVGLYTSESYNGTQWTDLSGSGNHATNKTGTINQNRNGFNNRDYVSGGTTAGIKFPVAILPSTYTLFHVAKYNGANRQRIFNGDNVNFLSGFHDLKSGVAFHQAWITQYANTNGGEWIVCTDQLTRFRSQKANRTTIFPANTTNCQLTINYSAVTVGENSDWAVAAVIVFNRELTINEILQMENWLYVKYNLSYMPPIMWGMVGMYTGESWTGTRWTDISGNSNHVTSITGTVTNNYSSTGLGGRDFISGVPATKLVWPVGILPTNYTIIHLCKYNGTNRGRILDGNDYNWLSGFWGTYSGVAYHEGWLTPNSTSIHGENWVLSTDQNSLYRSNRVNRTTLSPGNPSNARLAVNPSTNTFELSDWAIACIIIYNRTLTATEYNVVENWVAQRYSFSSMVTDTTIYKTPDPPTSNMVLWVDALTHSSAGANIIDNSQNAYNFTLTNANAFRTDGLVPHFNFEGSYGYATRTSDIPKSSNATIIAFATILNSTSTYRTLLRGSGGSSGNQVTIETGSNRLGMLNGTSGTFLYSGIDVVSLPTPYTSFNMLVWRIGTSSPYYKFSIGRDEKTYNITDVNSTFNDGIAALGSNYIGTQPWGKLSTFLYYSRYLSSAELADIYNQYEQIYNFPFPGDARYFEDGQWNILYEFTKSSRDSSGNLSYSQNNASALTNKSHSRVAYFMQNRMANGVMYYIYVSMDAYDTSNTNLNKYRVPDTVNTTGIQQRNVTNLVIYSNHPQVGNYSTTNGRIEIWPYNYTTTNYFGDGNTSTYDVDDTNFGTGTYGCVQVHDMNTKKTLLAWNNHGSGITQDIGIGNNDSSNIHYVSAVGADWTFAANGSYGWKFQVLVNTDKEFVNTISNLDSLVGAYSLQRVSNTYTGPTVTVRRSTDNITADFYANISGDLGTGLNATGQSLVNWLAGGTAYVTNWYDQSGRNNHAYQKTTSAQPTININGKFIFFATNQYLNMPDGTVPYNNSPYTIIIKHDVINNTSSGLLCSGIDATYYMNGIRRSNDSYLNFWNNNASSIPSGYREGNVVSFKYDGSNRYGYINGSLQVTTANVANRTSTPDTNTIGVVFTSTPIWMNGGMYFAYIFNTAISDSDRLKAEASFWIQPEITGVVDNLSGVARNSLVGVWSVKRVMCTYYGPTINVRRGSDNMTQDFYSDINGNLGTLLNGRGQSITSWLSGATGYVTIWYDQSGYGKHATQTVTASQPTIDVTNKQISFRNSLYFDLPDSTVPTGNSNYSFVTKHNTVGGAPGCIISAGTYVTNNVNALEFTAASLTYNNFWWANDLTFTSTAAVNNVVSVTYANTIGRKGYVNGSLRNSDTNTGKSTGTGNNRIGGDNRGTPAQNHWLNGELYYIYVFNDALTDVDRLIVEAT